MEFKRNHMRVFGKYNLSRHDSLTLVMLVSTVLLSFLLYRPALNSYFVSEDLRHVTFGWAEVTAEFSDGGQSAGYRPGTTLYLVINNVLWGRNQVGHHATVFFLHGVVGWLVYLVVQRVTGEYLPGLLAALVFVAAPIHTEAVIWLAAAAGTVTSGLLCMLAIWLWVRKDSQPASWTIALVAVFYLLALLIKEVAVVLPLILLLVDWRMKRFESGLRPVLRKLLSYWPLAAAFGLYFMLHYSSGALDNSFGYGVRLNLTFPQIADLWSIYARDLFRPLSTFVEWKIGAHNWIWLGIFVILLHLVRKGRWGALWTMVALLPGATAYAPRLTYLSVVGLSILIGETLIWIARGVEGWLHLESKPSRYVTYAGIGMAIFAIGLLVADTRAIHRDAANWVKAGELTWSIPRQARELLPEPPENAGLYFADLPDNVNGAYAYRWGIDHEVRHVYNNPDLAVHHVIPGPPRWGKVVLASIPCEAAHPRFFFKYDYELEELRMVGLSELGLDCPQSDNQ